MAKGTKKNEVKEENPWVIGSEPKYSEVKATVRLTRALNELVHSAYARKSIAEAKVLWDNTTPHWVQTRVEENGWYKRDEDGEYVWEDALDDDGNKIPEEFSSYRVSVSYPSGFTSYNESLIDFNVDEMMEFMAVISSYAEDKKDVQKNLPTLAKKIRTLCEVALTQAHTRAVKNYAQHIESAQRKARTLDFAIPVGTYWDARSNTAFRLNAFITNEDSNYRHTIASVNVSVEMSIDTNEMPVITYGAGIGYWSNEHTTFDTLSDAMREAEKLLSTVVDAFRTKSDEGALLARTALTEAGMTWDEPAL